MSHPAAARDRSEGGTLSVARREDALVIRLAGGWRLGQGVPSRGEVERALASPPRVGRIVVDTSALGSWDSGVVTFLAAVSALCHERGIAFQRDQLPSGLGRLLALAEAVPEKKDARRTQADLPILERVGVATLAAGGSLREIIAFLGEVTVTIGKLFRREARFRTSDLFLFIQQVGVDALPIVTLITFLVGAIFAFVGAVQLEQFGAQIYVADLVGIAMVREMGAIMTAIVMAGRSGAAFAAQLGTMTVNQEIDALRTAGISPLEFLVLPRVVALFLMMPLLCLYADLMGILGGAAVGIGMLGLSPSIYFQESANAIGLDDLVGGVFKASVYGVLVAMAGCLRGMQSGKSSSAVGDATTAAVVTSIVWIITACGLFAVIFYILGI
jgi:phospholipid/cholesterol/gamma-HCH transport system permease protein